MPHKDSSPHDFLFYLSSILGWSYFFLWTISFYPQAILNYRRKSVSGLSFDFLYYNLTGYTGYVIFTIWGYCDPKMGTGTIAVQDIFYSVHSWILTVFTIYQTFLYYDKNDPKQKVSITWRIFTVNVFIGYLQLFFMEWIVKLYSPYADSSDTNANTYNSLIYLGWCKVMVSTIKFIPQVILNCRRKSTVGWSIVNILLDFGGGLLSFAQNIVDTVRGEDVIVHGDHLKAFNITKFAISIVTILFDVIFFVQHYCLYRKNNGEKDKLNENENVAGSISKGYGDFISNSNIDCREVIIESENKRDINHIKS